MRRRTLKTIQLIILIFGLGILHELIALVFSDRVAGMVAYGLWLAAVLVIGHYTSQLRIAQLRRLWGLADELGYDEAELSRRAPQYGRIDWALSRPEKLQFFPRDRVVARLADELTLEYAQRTGVC